MKFTNCWVENISYDINLNTALSICFVKYHALYSKCPSLADTHTLAVAFVGLARLCQWLSIVRCTKSAAVGL